MISVALGGSKIRKSRSNFSDPTEGSNVKLSIAPIPNKKRRLKAVLDMLDGID